ncbi:MAG: RES family NAD+ phosphorylase [Longimicrobiales bacterium]|nr:RES family NAD+ phosphorylase [Longimicrobiales bacterium]
MADPEWNDPLDPRWARQSGGRWNPPDSHPTLYLNADIVTARLQLVRLLEGTPVEPEDLADTAYLLVATTLPRRQRCAVALTPRSIVDLGLPESYPADREGQRIPHSVCQRIGVAVHRHGLRGVLARSAASVDGRGTELAWFPATDRSRARPVWDALRDFGEWRGAERWEEIGLEPQPEVR